MLDMHCHILPDVDDGSRDRNESSAMLEAAKAAGITEIICTPHFKDDSFSDEEVFEAFDWFADAANSKGIRVSLGYEVHWRKIDELGMESVLSYAL